MTSIRMACALLLVTAASGAQLRASEGHRANPVRKVVTMLQKMEKKVVDEGKEQEALYEKFMCYCTKSLADLEASQSGGSAKIESLTSALKEAVEKKAVTEKDLKDHQTGRADAEASMKQATGIREKQAAEFAAEAADRKANIAAVEKAISAIGGGAASAFLQTGVADRLRGFVMEKAQLPDMNREELLSFLSDGSESTGSGEIMGILKQLGDDMRQGLEEATSAEKAEIPPYEELMRAKKKEVTVLSHQIEVELKRVGELGVEIAGMQGDLDNAKSALGQDGDFVAQLKKNCDDKTKEWEEIKKMRQEELLALADTIRVLNDDDALDLFKKTLPTPAASLLQLQRSAAAVRASALSTLRGARRTSGPARPELEFVALALQGKQTGFKKVVKMCDTMAANLKKEQVDDDSKKEYCEAQFDTAEDKEKEAKQAIKDSSAAIEEAEGEVAAVKDEILDLERSLNQLDLSVVEATRDRKEENQDYEKLIATDTAAEEVLRWAKNRLNKFYNPKLYKAPPKRELSEEERITVNMGGELAATAAPGGIAGTGISAFVQLSSRSDDAGAPPPPPETFGAYAKKGGDSNGVIAMMDLLLKDLEREMTEAKAEEKEAQADYEKMIVEAARKRTQDAKSLTVKTKSKAELEDFLEAAREEKKEGEADLMAARKYTHSLHGECDWLLKYYDVRKTARTDEIDALMRAKDVLSGADYAML